MLLYPLYLRCVVLTQFALSGNDDKRVIMEDRIRTMAYGHYSLRKPEVGSDK